MVSGEKLMVLYFVKIVIIFLRRFSFPRTFLYYMRYPIQNSPILNELKGFFCIIDMPGTGLDQIHGVRLGCYGVCLCTKIR